MKMNNILVKAYENPTLGWKMNAEGIPEFRDGNPVYVDDKGEERTVGLKTVTSLMAEAKQHREAKEAAEKLLKSYNGIDAEKARDALDKLGKIDAKELIDAGKVDELKNQITQQFQAQLSEKETNLQSLQQRYDTMVVNNTFANSEFIRNNIAVPRDMFEATFRNNFKVENGEVIVVDKEGNRLYSKEKAGEYATPEEGLKILTESHPQRDAILKADVGNGSGNKGAGGTNGGGRKITRTEFETLSPAKQQEITKKIKSGEMMLTD